MSSSWMANQAIRKQAQEKGVPMWALASEMGVSENTLYRRMRFELPQVEQEKYLKAIDTLCERASGAAEG